jgi:ketosteroid isomerase-like protein
MKKSFETIGLVLALLVFVTLSTHGQATPPENPAHQELRQMRDGLLDAMNKGDFEGTLKFLETNVVITWQNAEVSRGQDGVRSYYNRIMTGPNKIVDSFSCSIHPDELTILYGNNMGICYGSSDEHYKLTNGRELNVKGRWTATLVKENGHWLVASLHCSTDLFDNVMLDIAKKAAWITGAVSLGIGVLLGLFVGLLRRRAA